MREGDRNGAPSRDGAGGAQMDDAYVIVSPKHTRAADRYVTFWRSARAGYCWPLSWAGHYSRGQAHDIDDTFEGADAFAVPLRVALALSTPPRKGHIDGDAGPVVRNTIKNMTALRSARLQPTVEGRRAPTEGAPQ